MKWRCRANPGSMEIRVGRHAGVPGCCRLGAMGSSRTAAGSHSCTSASATKSTLLSSPPAPVSWCFGLRSSSSRNAVGPMGKARAWHPAGAQDTVRAELFSIPAQSHQGSSSQELQQLHWAAPLLPGLHSASPSRTLRSFALNAEMLLGTRLCTLGLQGALSRMQPSSKHIQLPKLQAEP